MKYIELQREFESSTGLLDEISDMKISSDDIFYYLNMGLISFVKDRIEKGFQSNQVITDDLSTLVSKIKIQPGSINFSAFSPDGITYSIDYKAEIADRGFEYWAMVGEDVGISSTASGWPVDTEGVPVIKSVDVIESTIENVTSRLNNSLSEHNMHNFSAKPIRVFFDDLIYLYTDGTYLIEYYETIYIKKPDSISVPELGVFEEYDGMPSSTHKEIIKYAVNEFLETIKIKKSIMAK